MHSIRTMIVLAAATTLAGGCAVVPKRTPPPVGTSVTAVVSKSDGWMGVANAGDRARIARLEFAWQTGLSAARAGGFGDALRGAGKLLVARAALSRPAPTPGSYSCRLVTLGRSAKKGPPFEKFKPFFCYVDLEGELFTIVKQTGSSRPAGRLWEDDNPTRLIFLGSLALGNEEEARAYGADPSRDTAGTFERIAPFRWRLVIPFPQDGTRLHVYELSPVAEQPAA